MEAAAKVERADLSALCFDGGANQRIGSMRSTSDGLGVLGATSPTWSPISWSHGALAVVRSSTAAGALRLQGEGDERGRFVSWSFVDFMGRLIG